MSSVTYRLGNDLDLDAVIELYRSSTLGERRPVDERERMRLMVENANLTVTAWDGEQLIGISRTLTDFSYVAYLADLAVHLDYQRRGIGTELVRRTQAELDKKASLVLLAAPKARDYYPRIGFERHPDAWLLGPGKEVVR